MILSQGNCSDTSSCHNIIILGSDESGFKNEFVIYPNPTDGNFSIYSIKLLESVNIEIKDVFGRIIFKGNYNGKKWDFVIQEKSGIYFVTTQSKYDLRVF